jgi:predicted esterase YcpF (UPF0227 family)
LEQEMIILYVHGFGSAFDRNSPKIQTLSKIGNVIGYNVDYSIAYDLWMPDLVNVCKQYNVNYVVGCSMGGLVVSKISEILGIPFVALNPVLDPKISLQKYKGTHINHSGVEYTLIDSVIESYPEFSDRAEGLILLEKGDQVIDADETQEKMKNRYTVVMLEGGSHRFDQLELCINIIEEHYVHYETRS